MSEPVKRYLCWDPQTLDIDQERGDLVDLSDYQALQAECDILRARLAAMERPLTAADHIAALVLMGAKQSQVRLLTDDDGNVSVGSRVVILPWEMMP